MVKVRLAEPRRKEVFRALVEAQDQAMTVAASRKAVAKRFGVSERQSGRIAGHRSDTSACVFGPACGGARIISSDTRVR